jgi:peptidoglycan/LPS O-acetylase OafA/YrhL
VPTGFETANSLESSTVITHQEIKNFPSTEYRPDIDGLRAIAVGIVVIFHAWPELLTGGFIGVDLFFVISGYFITQILVNENIKNKFSYFNFYNRRVKRIYPALIVVLLFVLWMTIRYSDLEHVQMTTKTMAASTIFGANI